MTLARRGGRGRHRAVGGGPAAGRRARPPAARSSRRSTDVDLAPARNEIPLHSWGDPAHEPPGRATAAFLAVPSAEGDLGLRAGDVLVLADLPAAGPDDPAGGPVQAGDPARRQAVRLDRDARRPRRRAARPTWPCSRCTGTRDDALPGPLVVTEPAPDGGPQTRAVALANVVLADHGASVAEEPLDPPQPAPATPLPAPAAARRRWRSSTRRPTAPPGRARVPSGAAALARPDPRAARAALTLDDGERTWTPQPDLLASGRLDAHVVVEPEPDGVARLRFGDGVTGRGPAAGSTFRARYRLGGGRRGRRRRRPAHPLAAARRRRRRRSTAPCRRCGTRCRDRRHRPRGRSSWSGSSRRSPSATSGAP